MDYFIAWLFVIALVAVSVWSYKKDKAGNLSRVQLREYASYYLYRREAAIEKELKGNLTEEERRILESELRTISRDYNAILEEEKRLENRRT